MRRGDVTVMSISAVLAVVAAGAVAFSLLVVDRTPESARDQPADSTSTLLVMTWAPSLCKTDPSNPGCRDGHVQTLGRRLILHGLWPQPRTEQFCDVSREVAERVRDLDNQDMPPVDVSAEVQARLESVMSDAAVLVPHEWYTHGTCSGVAPEEYFRAALSLADEVAEVLDPVFVGAERGKLSLSSVRHRLDESFGSAAGDRVGMQCRDVDGEGIVAYELHLSLPPMRELVGTDQMMPLAEALARGPTVEAGCRRGRVP